VSHVVGLSNGKGKLADGKNLESASDVFTIG
jgi:hypothetical protein